MMAKPHPSLVGPGGNPHLNACIHFSDGWTIYAAGYRKAAERLTQSVIDTGRDQDTLIYPIIFLWRHHVELQLKVIARGCSRILGRPWSPPQQHDLAQLFGETRVLLEEMFQFAGEKAARSGIDRLRGVLADFCSIDAGSFVFRYPEDLDGAATLDGVRYINYENVVAYFGELADLLDAAETAVSVFDDWHQEMLAAY